MMISGATGPLQFFLVGARHKRASGAYGHRGLATEQQKGNNAYLEADVKKDLKITDAQVAKIKAAIDKENKERQEMFENMNFDFERSLELTKATTAKIKSVMPRRNAAPALRFDHRFQLNRNGKQRQRSEYINQCPDCLPHL